MSRLDEFKAFVKTHPKMSDEVHENKTSWQKLYDEWLILGEEDKMWEKYIDKNATKKIVEDTSRGIPGIGNINMDTIKTVMNYAKKLDPDAISKTINSVQKVLSLISSFTGAQTAQNINQKTGDPLFDKNLDDWY